MSDASRRNIELKARSGNLSAAEKVAIGLGAQPQGLLIQTDTYFNVSNGRLKLRELGQSTELIWYNRPNSLDPRDCNYYVIPIPEPIATKAALGQALGIPGEVRKRRMLYLWENVRIHLDEVTDLGSFIEFEAVLTTDGDERVSRERLEELIRVFGIRTEDRVANSYVDLLGL
jgi:adenylate cyclase, class 2